MFISVNAQTTVTFLSSVTVFNGIILFKGEMCVCLSVKTNFFSALFFLTKLSVTRLGQCKKPKKVGPDSGKTHLRGLLDPTPGGGGVQGRKIDFSKSSPNRLIFCLEDFRLVGIRRSRLLEKYSKGSTVPPPSTRKFPVLYSLKGKCASVCLSVKTNFFSALFFFYETFVNPFRIVQKSRSRLWENSSKGSTGPPPRRRSKNRFFKKCSKSSDFLYSGVFGYGEHE